MTEKLLQLPVIAGVGLGLFECGGLFLRGHLGPATRSGEFVLHLAAFAF